MADLMQRLPQVKGELIPMAEMAKHTWFGVGGPAEVMFCPQDQDDLIQFMKALPEDIPVYPVGAGSNLLVRDGGMDGVVINTVKFMNTLERHDDVLTVGAGIHDAEVARAAARLELGGLELVKHQRRDALSPCQHLLLGLLRRLRFGEVDHRQVHVRCDRVRVTTEEPPDRLLGFLVLTLKAIEHHQVR